MPASSRQSSFAQRTAADANSSTRRGCNDDGRGSAEDATRTQMRRMALPQPGSARSTLRCTPSAPSHTRRSRARPRRAEAARTHTGLTAEPSSCRARGWTRSC
eukprot:1780706-Rhodomonas_salina.2